MIMSRSRYLTVVLLAATIWPATAAPQTTAGPEPGTATFLVFVRSQQVGQERVTLSRTPTGWMIQGTGRLGAPFDLATDNFEMRYAGDWQPVALRIAATFRGQPVTINTSFGLTTAISEIRQGTETSAKTDEMSARAVVLLSNFFGSYEALAARLPTLADGQALQAYVAPQGTAPLQIRSVSQQRLQRPEGPIALTRYEITVHSARAPLELQLWVDARRRMARLEVPSASLVIARQDLSSVMTRVELVRNPGDEDINVPANGFNLAATLTRPLDAPRRVPAVVLVGSSASQGRDEVVDGVPVFGQLAGDLAAAGFAVVRYDRRGAGQSGGRPESSTITDFAEDARAVVRYLRGRRDIDKDRVSVVGYGDGGPVALVTASREKRVAALVLVAAMGTTGAEFVLEQQQRALEGLNLSDGERQERIDLQKRILAAATSGSGWEDLPPTVRVQADTPWFRTFLTFDPAKAFEKARQPVLVVQPARDEQVPGRHADTLFGLANGRKKGEGAQMVTLEGVGHALAPPAATEDAERHVSPDVAAAIVEWLKQALADR